MFRRKSAGVAARSQSTPAGGGEKRSSKSLKGRAKSMPLPNASASNIKGIMKYSTEDESIHSKYGKGEKKDEDRRIEFKDILIREFARTVGDNPSCSSGPPISISWEYNPNTKVIALDKYEETRPERRTHFEMVLPRDVRQQMLKKEWDVTQAQIAAAVRANIKVKNQRRATVNNLGKAPKLEERIEKTGRLMKGLFSKSEKKKLEELQLAVAQVNSTQNAARKVSNEFKDDDEDVSPTEEIEGDLDHHEEDEVISEDENEKEEAVAEVAPEF